MAALVFCLASVALAFNFLPLTGRVVDQANIMSVQSRNDLEAKLKDLENKSGIQLVVATVKSLEGSDVETYANELFRNWKLGEAKKNNGVLLLVTPTEHKVRIEVGYGLEGTLTDALSSVIISSAIVPRFKANDITGGIERGVDGITSVLSGDTTDWQPKPSVARRFTAAFQRTFLDFVFTDRCFCGLVVDRWCPRYLVGSIRKAWRRDDLFAHWRFVGLFGTERRVWWRRRRNRWRGCGRRRLVGWRRRVGELVMEFTKEDHEAISAAIRKAEKQTCGQIVCVLAHSSSDYTYVPILWASVLALLIPWPLIDFTQLTVQRIFLLQLVVFILAGFIFSWLPLRLALVPPAVRRARAHRAALGAVRRPPRDAHA